MEINNALQAVSVQRDFESFLFLLSTAVLSVPTQGRSDHWGHTIPDFYFHQLSVKETSAILIIHEWI